MVEHETILFNYPLDGVGSQEFANGWTVGLGQSVAVDLSLRNDFEFEIRGEFRVDCYLQGQRCSQVSVLLNSFSCVNDEINPRYLDVM